MKLDLSQIKVCTVLVLLAIIFGQGVWIYNMYNTYKSQFSISVNESIETAILKEVSNRHQQLGGTIAYAPLTNSLDTARYITKTIQSQDTSFKVIQDRFDPYTDLKLIQFLLKDDLPVNLVKLDSLFRTELNLRGFPSSETYVEYTDLKNKQIIGSSYKKVQSANSFISSKTITIDIFKTLGIKAYAHSSIFSILQRMFFQLVLSSILVTICISFLFAIIRTFFWKEKIELMRQDSVNAMTHEFKRPISSAVAQASLIPYYLQKGEIAKVQQYANNILLELNKLTAYTDRVQKLSYNNRDHIDLNRENIVLKVFFETMVEKYIGIKDKLIDINLSLLTSHIYINADLLHFSNIIENLIENAIKYSEEPLLIDIDITDTSSNLVIRIKDNGFGISEGELAHIFDKFYRSNHKESQKKVGFGLGLTYVKSLIEAHAGEIRVKSKFGFGSEFLLYFPIK